MPDVTIDNPPVQIDLGSNTTTTVPNGEKWRVKLIAKKDGCLIRLNGLNILKSNSSKRAVLETDLFGGDTIKTFDEGVRIRGYRVD